MQEYTQVERNDKEINKISKVVYDEMFFHGMLETAGSQKAQMLDKITKNPRYMKNQDIALKVIVSIFQLVLCLTPIMAYLKFNEVYGTVDNYQLMFSLSTSVTMLFGFQLFYMLVFGINSLTGIFGVDSFTYLETLPISRKDMESIASKILFHGFRFQMLAIFLALPLGTIILMIIFKKFLLFALIVSFVKSYVVLHITMWLSVKISAYFAKKFSKYSSNSKKNTVIRILFGLMYGIGAMCMGLVMQFTFQFVAEIANASILPETMKEILTYIFSIIPILFSESYLYTLTFFPIADINLTILILSILGTIAAVLLAYKAKKSTENIVYVTAVKKEGIKGDDKEPIAELGDVNAEVITPVEAFIKRDIKSISRDIQLLMFVVMAFVMPAFSLLITMDVGEEMPDTMEMFTIQFVMISMYVAITSTMVFSGLTNIEDDGNAIGMSLPIVVREQAIARVRLALTILVLSPIPTFLFLIIQDPILYTVAMINVMTIPVAYVFILIVIYSAFFGKVNKKYTLNMVNIEYKVLKYIVIFVLVYGLCGFEIAIFFMIESKIGVIPALFLSILERAVLAAIFIAIFMKMFKGRKVYE